MIELVVTHPGSSLSSNAGQQTDDVSFLNTLEKEEEKWPVALGLSKEKKKLFKNLSLPTNQLSWKLD